MTKFNPPHPNREATVHPESRSGKCRATVLTTEQYEALENLFPIDSRADTSFQLGVQAVLKQLRKGLVTPA